MHVYTLCHPSYSTTWIKNAHRITIVNRRIGDDFVIPHVQKELCREFPNFSLPYAWKVLDDVNKISTKLNHLQNGIFLENF
jgi:hypothetical protein